MHMIRITAPHFVAGLVLERWLVTRAAPVLSYMVGWEDARVYKYCQRKNWAWEDVQ